MTTKLLPRLVATGVLAAGLTAVSALTTLASSAHAATAPAPVVSKGPTGSVDVTLKATDLRSLSTRDQASATCASAIVPSASGVIAQPTCTNAVYAAATTYASQHISVHINFRTDGTFTTSAVR